MSELGTVVGDDGSATRGSGVIIGDHASAIRDLGIRTDVDGDGLVGRIEVVPELLAPGSDAVRTSVLLTLADVVAGKFANATTQPRISVTLDLDLHLTGPTGGFRPGDDVVCRSWVVRSGRRITVMGFDLTDVEGRSFGFGHAGFMASPDPAHEVEGGFPLVALERFRLDRPLVERVGIERLGDGRVVVPDTIDNVNATMAIQGGLLALVAEEAVFAAEPDAMLRSMAIRYLRGFRDTRAVASADVRSGVARVDIVDEARGQVGAIVVAHLGAERDRR
jgi:acyl-coenzyme A thioesterase PaaI-like protein